MSMDNDLDVLLRELIGQRICAAFESEYRSIENIDGDELISFTLEIESGGCFTFSCAQDGESIQVLKEIPSTVDMSNYGSIVVMRVTDKSLLFPLVGRNITSLMRIVNSDNVVCGIRLKDGAEYMINALNLGDVLSISVKISEAIQTSEGLKYISI